MNIIYQRFKNKKLNHSWNIIFTKLVIKIRIAHSLQKKIRITHNILRVDSVRFIKFSFLLTGNLQKFNVHILLCITIQFLGKTFLIIRSSAER